MLAQVCHFTIIDLSCESFFLSNVTVNEDEKIELARLIKEYLVLNNNNISQINGGS